MLSGRARAAGRRVAPAVAAGLALLLTLAARGASGAAVSPPGSAGAPACAGAGPRLTLWFPDDVGGAVSPFGPLLAEHAAAAGVQVCEVRHRWEDLAVALQQTAPDAPEAPDVVLVGSTWIRSLLAAGTILPAAAASAADYTPAARVAFAGAPDGTPAVVPLYVDIHLLALDRAALPDAPPLATWDQLGRALTPAAPLVLSRQPGFQAVHALAAWTAAAGDDLFAAAGFLRPAEARFDRPAARAAVELLHGLAADGRAVFRDDSPDALALAVDRGAVPLTPVVRVPPGWRPDWPDRVRLVPFPGTGPAPATFVGGAGLALHRAAAHRGPEQRAAAAALVDFLAAPAQAQRFCRVTGHFPAQAAAFAAWTAPPALAPVRAAVARPCRAYPPLEGQLGVELAVALGLVDAVWRSLSADLSAADVATLLRTTDGLLDELLAAGWARGRLRLLLSLAVAAALLWALLGPGGLRFPAVWSLARWRARRAGHWEEHALGFDPAVLGPTGLQKAAQPDDATRAAWAADIGAQLAAGVPREPPPERAGLRYVVAEPAVPSAAQFLKWELLPSADPRRQPPLLQPGYSLVRRLQVGDAARRPRRPATPLTVLFLHAQAAADPFRAEEGHLARRLESALRARGFRAARSADGPGGLRVHTWRRRAWLVRAAQRLLRRSGALVFVAAHGGGAALGEGCLVGQGGLIRGTALARHLRELLGGVAPRVVVLTGCSLVRGDDPERPMVPRALLAGGVANVVAFTVDDPVVAQPAVLRAFAEPFLEGRPLDVAVHQLRRELHAVGGAPQGLARPWYGPAWLQAAREGGR